MQLFMLNADALHVKSLVSVAELKRDIRTIMNVNIRIGSKHARDVARSDACLQTVFSLFR